MDNETDELISEFAPEGGDFRAWRPGWNMEPTQTIPVLLDSAEGGDEVMRRLEPARWSLTPHWKELKTKCPTFDARSVTIAEKADF